MPKQLVKRTRAGSTWTEARYWQYIRSVLRRATISYPVIQQVKKAASKTVTGQRHKYEYKCKKCKKWWKGKEIAVDHIKPAGSLKGYGDLPGFVERLFCEADNLQVLCKDCHDKKTKADREAKEKQQ
jgi:5-methylcytosine-specific restriction endonuclease McrA